MLVRHWAVVEAWVGFESTLGAVVSLVEGVDATPLLVVRLLDHCRELLAAARCPQEIYFVDQMPRFRSGQVNVAGVLFQGFGQRLNNY